MSSISIDSTDRFSSLQLELLKTFSFEPTEEELREVKHLLAKYFFQRLRNEMAVAAEAKGITNDTLDEWLKETT